MRYSKLSELCTDIIDCPHTTPEWKDKGIRVVRNFNLRNGIIDFSDGYFVDEKTYLERTKRAKPEENDIIISREAPMGVVGIVPKGLKCCLGQRLVLLKVNKEKCNPYYLLCVLTSEFVQTQFRRADATGSIVSNLCIPDLKDILIPIIDDNQDDVAKILESLDKKIQLNTKINEILQQQASLLYDYWFTQFDFPDENGKPYKSSGGKMIWNEELKREIPEGWKVQKLGLCIKHINTGLNPRDNFVLNNGTIKYITVKNLTTDGNIDFSTCDTLDKQAHAIVHKRSDVSKGDVLFASIAPLGRCFLVQENPIDWDINESVFSIRPDVEHITSEYLYMYLMSEAFVKKAAHSSTGSIFSGIRISTLQQMDIIIPQNKTIAKFSSQITTILNQKYKNSQENQELIALRDWLLPMLMNGQATVAEEQKPVLRVVKNDTKNEQPDRFALWLQNQGLAARGDIDRQTLREIFDAMDDDDK